MTDAHEDESDAQLIYRLVGLPQELFDEVAKHYVSSEFDRYEMFRMCDIHRKYNHHPTNS
jgi:hypothetical protein